MTVVELKEKTDRRRWQVKATLTIAPLVSTLRLRCALELHSDTF